MPLEEYARKRSFNQTPEPGPEVAEGQKGRIFCVQRHSARRLHYDLRIEVGGTLKSWAVPQGPTLDPSIKRLAVMVEDHPLMYATFEGNIPKGNYGAGSMMLWDYGEWEQLGEGTAEQQLEKGDFKFALHGEKLRGTFALVRTGGRDSKKTEWLLLKKKDSTAQVGWDAEQFGFSVATGRTQDEIAANLPSRTVGTAAAMPGAMEPMLATLADDPPSGSDWIYEVKWDGVRAMAYVSGGQVLVRGRKGNEITRQYPELQTLPRQVNAREAVLDGEVAALDDNGRPSFGRIQPRIMASDASAIAKLAQSRPVVFFAFDLLFLNGRDLRGESWENRRRLLGQIVSPSAALRLSETFETDPASLLAAVRAQGLEGIVAKRRSSLYQPGRSREWFKVKATRQQEFLIAGYTHGERDFFGALLLGVWDQGVLHFAGSVGTGFDRKLMKAIRDLLDPLETTRPPFPVAPILPQKVVWIRPELVCTVQYLEWTGDGRLRAPVFVGMRTDVDPKECVRAGADAPPATRPPLLPIDKEAATVDVEGQQFLIKNLNKVFYPAEGYTKRDVIEYYYAVAPLLAPHLKDRPLSLRRYPDGIAKEGFFQKNAADGFPEWVRWATIVAEDHKERTQIVGGGIADLVYLANLGCIDQNPWMSRVDTLDHPDFILIDLDPNGCEYAKIVEAALLVKRMLDQLGMVGYPKTTGGDGMHVYVPLEPVYSYDQSRAVAEVLARLAAAQRPDLFTLPRSVGRREQGKVYFDYLQNARGKTISAPYVLRAYAGAPVATPLAWNEIRAGLNPKQFHLRNALERFDRVGDLFAGVLTQPQRLETAMDGLEKLARGGA